MFRVDEDCGEGNWEQFSNKQRGIRRDGWSQYANPFDGLTYWSNVSGRHCEILDPDFLRLNTFANNDERKSALSLCLMAGSPISIADQYDTIAGNLWLYQNKEILALNNDGFVGKPLSTDPTAETSQIWKGQMSNGDWVIGFFNRENDPRTRTIDFNSLGLPQGAYARNLWEHRNLGLLKSYSALVPPHGCIIVRLSNST
jgi:hypothetical protein